MFGELAQPSEKLLAEYANVTGLPIIEPLAWRIDKENKDANARSLNSVLNERAPQRPASKSYETGYIVSIEARRKSE